MMQKPLFGHRGKHEQCKDGGRDQPTDHDSRERPLDVRATARPDGHRNEADGRDERRHEHRAQPNIGARANRFAQAHALGAELVDVRQSTPRH